MGTLGSRLIDQFSQLSSQSKEIIEGQIKGGSGLGLWKDWRKLLSFFPHLRRGRALSPSPVNTRRRSNSRARDHRPETTTRSTGYNAGKYNQCQSARGRRTESQSQERGPDRGRGRRTESQSQERGPDRGRGYDSHG